MTCLKPLATMNNEGVRLYEKGELQQAKNCFQMCIDEMFKVIVLLKQEQEDLFAKVDDDGDDDDNDNDASNDTTTNERQSPIQGWSQPLAYTKRPGDGVFAFSRAIFLRDSTTTKTTPAKATFSDLSIFKLAIQYNKALTHHQISNSTVQSKYYSEDSEMAFHMYEQAFQSCKIESRANRPFQCSLDRGILMLALFNNVGVIFCSDLARFRDASECFKAACGVVLGMDLTLLGRALDADEMYLLSMNIWMAPKSVTPAA